MAESSEQPARTLGKQFIKFCNFGNHAVQQKKLLTDKNMTKMFKDCKLYGKSLTSTDTDIAFSKVKDKGKKEISLAQLKELLKSVSVKFQKDRKLDSPEVAYTEMVKLITDHDPALHGTTEAAKVGVTKRLTDSKQYTGSHKERFDESGKGRGIEGREEINARDGYVQGHKDRGTYDEKANDTN